MGLLTVQIHQIANVISNLSGFFALGSKNEEAAIVDLGAVLDNTYEKLTNKNAANGYAGLDANSKINPSQLPAIAVTDTFVVNTQVAMLALDAQTGDVAVRTDLNKSFILQGVDPSILGSWQELITPTDAVASVFGRTGVVTAQSGDYNADQVTETASRVFVTPAQKTVLGNTSGTNSGNETTASVGALINGSTAKATPVDADMFGLMDSAASNVLKKLSWANLKTALGSVFATLSGATFTGAIVGTTIEAQHKKKIQSTTSTSTFTHNYGSYDVGKITAQAVSLTMAAPSGTPYDLQEFILYIKDNGVSRSISWNAAFTGVMAALPSSTTAGKQLVLFFAYNSTTSKLELMNIAIGV